MAMQKQTSWGWMIVADVFLGGVGAGLFLVSFLLGVVFGPSGLTKLGTIVGPLLVVVGVLLLLLEVGKPLNAVRAFLNVGTSWMSRGVVLTPVLIVLGLVYALIPLPTTLGWVIGWLAAVFAVLVALYHGFMLSQARAIPLWNTPLLPMLYFTSALAGGTGCLMLLTLFAAAPEGLPLWLAVTEIAMILLVLIALWLMTTVQSTAPYRESVKKLTTPGFNVIVVGVGSVIPLIFLIIGVAGGIALSPALLAICGTLVLIGAYYLRHAAIGGGYYYSLEIAL